MFTQAYLDTVVSMQQVQRDEKAAQAKKDFKCFVTKKSKSRAKTKRRKRGERMSEQYSKSCCGCLAEYQGECVTETCYGKLIRFSSPINRPDSKEWHKKAYEFSADEFKRYFTDDYREENTNE